MGIATRSTSRRREGDPAKQTRRRGNKARNPLTATARRFWLSQLRGRPTMSADLFWENPVVIRRSAISSRTTSTRARTKSESSLLWASALVMASGKRGCGPPCGGPHRASERVRWPVFLEYGCAVRRSVADQAQSAKMCTKAVGWDAPRRDDLPDNPTEEAGQPKRECADADHLSDSNSFFADSILASIAAKTFGKSSSSILPLVISKMSAFSMCSGVSW
jgi:hypothetical protein